MLIKCDSRAPIMKVYQVLLPLHLSNLYSCQEDTPLFPKTSTNPTESSLILSASRKTNRVSSGASFLPVSRTSTAQLKSSPLPRTSPSLAQA